MLSEGNKQLVVDEIQKHYEEQAQPYYLAKLGQFLRSVEIEVPAGKRLKDFLTETFQDRLVVVQDSAVPARIAIAPPDNSEQVQEQLAGRFLPTPGRPPIEVNRLPFSLIAAFCQMPKSGLRVFYRTIRPSRYAIGLVAPDHTYIEIEDDFRQPVPEGTSIHELSMESKQGIYRRISEWAAIHNVNLEATYVNEKGGTSISGINRRIPISNALERLVEAQEPELRKRIHVPGDIALVLMRIE